MAVIFRLITSLFLSLFVVIRVVGQSPVTLTGRVIDEVTEEPLPGVAVYFNNTTLGTNTDNEGKFELQSNPGRVEIVVSLVGFDPIIYPMDIKAGQTPRPFLFKLTEKVELLGEVTIQGKRSEEWYTNLEVFKENFIGTSKFSKDCKIKNPEILMLDFDHKTRILTASSKEVMTIENNALGYTLHYLLGEFVFDMANGYVSFVGFPRFEPMKGGSAKQKRWRKNRLAAYHGSSMELGRVLRNQALEENGYNLRKLIRTPNPERPTEKELQKARELIGITEPGPKHDSLSTFLSKARLPKVIEKLDTTRVPYSSFITKTDTATKLAFTDYFNVVYTKEKEEESFIRWSSNAFSSPRKPTFQTSVISLIEPFVLIEPNGMFVEPLGIIFEGYMGWEKVSNMLPLDFQP